MNRSARSTVRKSTDILASAMAGRLAQDVEPEIEWVHYPRLEPGVYSAYCHFARTYFDRNFNRWTCLLRFEVRSDDLLRVISPHIPFWLNLGSKEKPHATRRGKYFKEWVKANSGDGPTRRDRLAPHIFTRRMARVEIGDTKALAPYSVVQKIVSWDTSSGLAGHEVNKSHSQERHLSQPRKGSI